MPSVSYLDCRLRDMVPADFRVIRSGSLFVLAVDTTGDRPRRRAMLASMRSMLIKTSLLPKRRMALLVDADNVSWKSFGLVASECSAFGDATVRRVYGKSEALKPWTKVIEEHSLSPRQVSGKNATDFAITIDAMDLLHSETRYDFCLVSSDSDFMPLAMRIRKESRFVLGMGYNKTPDVFVNACSHFKHIDVLERAAKTAAAKGAAKGAAETAQPTHAQRLEALSSALPDEETKQNFKRFCEVVEEEANANGWSSACRVGSRIVELGIQVLDFGASSKRPGRFLKNEMAAVYEHKQVKKSGLWVRPKCA